MAGLEPEPGGPHGGVQGHTHQQDRQEEGQQDPQLLQALLPGRSQGNFGHPDVVRNSLTEEK